MSGADDYNLSQIISYDDVDIWSLEPLVQIVDAEALTNRRSNPRPQNRAPHGIDFKKPIHNVKYGSSRPNHRALARRTVSLHHLDMWLACRTREPVSRTPYSIRGLALWARFAALAGLADVRISFANSSRLLRLGGAYRDRTDDLMLAKQPLSQLS